MPTHDFIDIGDVLNYEFLQGTIASIDESTDTCTVTVGSSIIPALLFWHGTNEDVLRSNGAISGAASYFSVGDSVIVMCKKHGINAADNKVITGGTASGKVWVIGPNIFGCLGDGRDYTLMDYITYGGWTGDPIDTMTRWFDSSWYVDWDFCLWWNRDALSALENEGWTITDHTYQDAGYLITFNKYSYREITSHDYSLYWPLIVELSDIKFRKKCVWASSKYMTSFIIDYSGNMYCAGNNIWGQLGIGAQTGWSLLDSSSGAFTAQSDPPIDFSNYKHMKPNYYSKTFINVPGAWAKVHTTGKITAALDSNGYPYVAGDGYTSTFTKISNDKYDHITDSDGSIYFWKELELSYSCYLLTGNSISFGFEITKADFALYYPGASLDDLVEATEGDGNIFIGGSTTDILFIGANKPAGTLWRRSGGTYTQLGTDTDWLFVAGSTIALKR